MLTDSRQKFIKGSQKKKNAIKITLEAKKETLFWVLVPYSYCSFYSFSYISVNISVKIVFILCYHPWFIIQDNSLDNELYFIVIIDDLPDVDQTSDVLDQTSDVLVLRQNNKYVDRFQTEIY
jgi:hypothetical protein